MTDLSQDQVEEIVDQPADTGPAVDAKLNEIWDKHRPDEPPAAPLSSPDAAAGDQRARDEQGRFATKTEVATPADAAATEKPAAEAAQPVTGQVQAPDQWPAEKKAQFEKLTDDGRSLVLSFSKELEAGFTRRMQDLGNERRRYESLNPVLAPIEAEARKFNVSTATALQGLWQAHMNLIAPETRMQALKQIADDYGVDLGEAAKISLPPRTQAPALPPEVDSRLQRVESFIQTSTTEAQEASLRNDAAQIDAWSKEADDHGGLKRPHVDALVQRMAVLVPALKQANPQVPLLTLMQDAYDAACAADPVIRQKLIDDGVSRKLSDRQNEERQRGTKAASVASTSVSRRGGGIVAPNGDGKNVDAILNSVFDKHYGSA